MTKYKNEYIVKVRRKVVAWQETTYVVSYPDEEGAVNVAMKETLFKTSIKGPTDSGNGIISMTSEIDPKSIRRLNQEEAWILDTKECGIGEIPAGNPVAEVLFADERKTEKPPKHSKSYWRYHVMKKTPET